MNNFIAGAFGFLGALVAHDLAAQALLDLPLRPLTGTCPRCGARRGWLAARCPSCDRPIGREILLIGVGIAVAVGFANTIGPAWALIPYIGFLWLTLALGITDIDSFRIVDRLNIRGTVVLVLALGVASLADASGGAWVRAVLGGLAYFAGTNLMFLLVRGRGFGYGDVKLSAQLGVFTAYLSWGTLGWSVFLTAAHRWCSLHRGTRCRVGRQSRQRTAGGAEVTVRDAMRAEVPYGPPMILGAWIAIVLVGLGAIPIPT